jgi:hypothetical protein
MKYRLLPCLVALAFLTTCSWWPSHTPTAPKEKPATTAPTLVGRIASTPADKRFVLIQNYGNHKIATGTILTTRGPEERTANLLATGESLGPFAAADLQSGRVQIGDAVYSRHIPQAPAPPSNAQPVDNEPKMPEAPF